MQITQFYSHLNGYEHILVHHRALWQELQDVVASVDAELCRTKVSGERRKAGKILYSPDAMNVWFKRELKQRGWSERRTSYYVTDDKRLISKTMQMRKEEQKQEILDAGKTPIFSYNQTDFVKDRIQIEVQFGKYSFVAYDLFVKHMAFFIGDVMDVGIEILPMKSLQAEMSLDGANYEDAVGLLGLHENRAPAVPLVLIGVAAQEAGI